MIKRALIHVENTENLLDLAKYLNNEDWTILCAGRTEETLRKNKINVKHESAVDESSQFFADKDLLTKQISETVIDVPDELLHSQENDYGISLICINAYPTMHFDLAPKDIKNILKPQNFFITTILRLAYQNYENILLLTDPSDYKEAIIQLKTDNITPEFRAYLAAKTLNFISAYDAGISASVLRSSTFNNQFMNYLMIPFTKETDIAKGSNPQQKAALYRYPADTGSLSGLSKIQANELNYNIISDVSNCWEFISTLYTNLKNQFTVKSINRDGYEFTTQFTPLTGTVFSIVVKFGLIVGASLSTDVLNSIKNTYTSDREYLSDVTLGCSAVIDETAAQELLKGNYAAIVAPSFTPEAKEILSSNKKIHLISTSKVHVTKSEGRLINGGLLMQSSDKTLFDYWTVRTINRPSQQITDEMAFGMLLSLGAHSYSAILLKHNHIVGIAQSCTSCEKAVSEALYEAKKTAEMINQQSNEPINDNSVADILVCGSPITFTASVRNLIDSGIYGIIQPGGTQTDEDFIKYCDERGLVMVFTNMTHYNH